MNLYMSKKYPFLMANLYEQISISVSLKQDILKQTFNTI